MIGKALKYMRNKKKLSQEQMSLIIKTNQQSLSRYENEQRQIDFETIEKFANNCGYKIYFINDETKDKFQIKDLIRKDV